MSKTFPVVLRHGEQPTRTPGTELAYQKIVSQSIRRLAKKYELDSFEIPSEALVADLKERASTLSKNSARTYKATLITWQKSQELATC